MSRFFNNVFLGSVGFSIVLMVPNNVRTHTRRGCVPDHCATLIYVPQTGLVVLDGRNEAANIRAYLLQAAPESQGFKSGAFTSPFGNEIAEQVADDGFIGDFDLAGIGLNWLELGAILPTELKNDDALVSSLSVASYATTEDDDERIFNFQVLTSPLQAGDADQDLDFDQLDLVRVQAAAKYLTGQPATWGTGDWNGAPGGQLGNPPGGDGLFDQSDIVAALTGGVYLSKTTIV